MILEIIQQEIKQFFPLNEEVTINCSPAIYNALRVDINELFSTTAYSIGDLTELKFIMLQLPGQARINIKQVQQPGLSYE